MYISTGEMYYSYLAAARYIWRPPLKRMRCIFQVQRCIFQLVRCIIPIWRPPDISGGRHLENVMYISSGKMYVLTGEMYISSTSHQLKYKSFHLKYTSHSVSGGRQIYLAAINSYYYIYFKWKDVYFNW